MGTQSHLQNPTQLRYLRRPRYGLDEARRSIALQGISWHTWNLGKISIISKKQKRSAVFHLHSRGSATVKARQQSEGSIRLYYVQETAREM